VIKIIFGASKLGSIAYLSLTQSSEKISYFMDNDQGKWGSRFMGIEVLPPSELNKMPDVIVIIASMHYKTIAKQLVHLGLDKILFFALNVKTPREPVALGSEEYSLKEINRNVNQLVKNRISLIYNNHSGSNTMALYKLIPPEVKAKYEVNLINEDQSNASTIVAQSKMVVCTHVGYHGQLEQISIQLWHGIGVKGIFYMDAAFLEDNNAMSEFWRDYSAIISSSNFYNIVINSCIRGDINKFKITGLPRNDFLFLSQGRRNLILLAENKVRQHKVVLFCPTYRVYEKNTRLDGTQNIANIFGFEYFDSKSFQNYLVENDICLIIKAHPDEEFFRSGLYREYEDENIFFLNEEMLKQMNLDFYEILNAVDLLITDYSSIYCDYLLLDRPIIFTPVDLNVYRKTRGFVLEPYDFWTPGPKALNQKDLEHEILECLEKPDYYTQERKTIKELVHQYEDGYSSNRVWQLIDTLMNQ
jgi:CDP-glycerol glycerophosphotransferase (TagB/SpsB family)